MTVSANNPRLPYNGDAVSVAFTSPYFLAAADLKVYVGGVLKTLTTDYTVSGAGVASGGTVTFLSAPAAGTGNVVILRDPDQLQATQYPSNDTFPSKAHETALDKLTMLLQRARDLIGRSFTLSDSDTSGASLTVPTPAASKFIRWNASANALEYADVVGQGSIGLPITVAQGGTNATTAAAARTNLGAASLAANTFTGLQNLAGGADIASATAVDLTAATGNTVVITGTTPSTSLVMNAGQQMLLLPSGAWPMTYHATTMNINGGVSYTCAAGDRVFAVKDLAGVIRVTVWKQDGTPVVAGTPAGTIIDFGGASAPMGFLACDGSAVSRTTYAALFTAIGTLWGAGNGSTTFNVPNFTAGFASVQTAGTVGASTVGEVIAHTHNVGSVGATSGAFGTIAGSSNTPSSSTGGTNNLAAGMYVLKCIKT